MYISDFTQASCSIKKRKWEEQNTFANFAHFYLFFYSVFKYRIKVYLQTVLAGYLVLVWQWHCVFLLQPLSHFFARFWQPFLPPTGRLTKNSFSNQLCSPTKIQKQARKLQATLVRNYDPLTRSQGWSVELLA